jgi:hypothetical protein
MIPTPCGVYPKNIHAPLLTVKDSLINYFSIVLSVFLDIVYIRVSSNVEGLRGSFFFQTYQKYHFTSRLHNHIVREAKYIHTTPHKERLIKKSPVNNF